MPLNMMMGLLPGGLCDTPQKDYELKATMKGLPRKSTSGSVRVICFLYFKQKTNIKLQIKIHVTLHFKR